MIVGPAPVLQAQCSASPQVAVLLTRPVVSIDRPEGVVEHFVGR